MKKIESMFEKFWKIYPLKKHRDESLAVWLKLNPTPEQCRKINAHIRFMKNGEFVFRSPAAWLKTLLNHNMSNLHEKWDSMVRSGKNHV